MQPWASEFYHSAAWRTLRDAIIRRDTFLCQDCLKAGRLTPAEEVHHIQPLTPENIKDPQVALNPELLISVCRECHQTRHGARQRRYSVDEFGRVKIK